MPGTTSGPVTAGERVAELDVLRGIALYGVFLMNMVFFGHTGMLATDVQLLSLPNAALDHVVLRIIDWLVGDKANTLFAFLFGLGFYLQMQRAGATGRDFDRLYLRRLSVLLVFGLLHTLFIFVWDILSIYAVAGFMLFALRKASDRVLLWGGLALALMARISFDALAEYGGIGEWHGLASPFGEAAILVRQQLALAADYPALVTAFGNMTLYELLNGAIVGWIFYALGRFMLGAWVGRRGWLQKAGDYLPGFRRVLRVALPAGLIAEGAVIIIEIYDRGARLPEWAYWEPAAEALHMVAVPVLAAGYVCAIVIGLHTAGWRRVLAPFGAVGRMALSNYVMQSLVCAFVFFGVGLGLAGRVGTIALLAGVTAAFAGQVLLSRWWLARYRYGPLEWLWRGLTYEKWPPFRHAR